MPNCDDLESTSTHLFSLSTSTSHSSSRVLSEIDELSTPCGVIVRTTRTGTSTKFHLATSDRCWTVMSHSRV
jgi:hypothetical protein